MATYQIRPIRVEGNIAYVPLTRGLTAMIDAADVPLVSDCNWHAGRDGYARRTFSNGKAVYLHRALACPPDGFQVDHINGDKLDNRRSNLRPATKAQNAYNVGPRRTNTSGFKGVRFYKQTSKWVAQIMSNGVRHHLGYFATPEAASAAYVAASARLHGDFGRAA